MFFLWFHSKLRLQLANLPSEKKYTKIHLKQIVMFKFKIIAKSLRERRIFAQNIGRCDGNKNTVEKKNNNNNNTQMAKQVNHLMSYKNIRYAYEQ